MAASASQDKRQRAESQLKEVLDQNTPYSTAKNSFTDYNSRIIVGLLLELLN